jgi:hypothetical protein
MIFPMTMENCFLQSPYVPRVRLHLLVGDAERDGIFGFFGKLMFNPSSSHFAQTNGSVVRIGIYE